MWFFILASTSLVRASPRRNEPGDSFKLHEFISRLVLWPLRYMPTRDVKRRKSPPHPVFSCLGSCRASLLTLVPDATLISWSMVRRWRGGAEIQ